MFLVALAACGGGQAEAVKLDGSPRYADDQGIATEVTHENITLDDERSYAVADGFRSFSTYTLKLEPMLNREGQFVHLGIDDGEAVWMAGFGAVVPGEPAFVPYQGTVKRVDRGDVVFVDGTVLPLGRGVEPPEPGSRVTAQIDPDTGRILVFR